MENINKQLYDMMVLPLVITEEGLKNGKRVFRKKDNLSYEEIRGMSCEPRMLKETPEHVYFEEMPITFKGGTGILGSLYYVFGELSSEEQEKYRDRCIVIQTTIEEVVKIYNDASKRFFSKKREDSSVNLSKNKPKKRVKTQRSK